MDQNGDIAADLDITSWVLLPMKDPIQEQLGSFERQRLILNQDALLRLKLLNEVGKILAFFSMFSKA